MIDIGSPYVIPFDARVDIVIMMDCCYPYMLTNTQPGYRRVDILAAADEKDPVAFGSDQTHSLSFTSEIYTELQARAMQGAREVEMAKLITSFQDRELQMRAPTYIAKLGFGSVTLPIVCQTLSSASPSRHSLRLLVTFAMHISEPLTTAEVNDILRSISPASEGQAFSFKLDQIKRTSANSTLIILESPLSAFYRIAGLPGVFLICENYAMLPV